MAVRMPKVILFAGKIFSLNISSFPFIIRLHSFSFTGQRSAEYLIGPRTNDQLMICSHYEEGFLLNWKGGVINQKYFFQTTKF